MGTCDHCGASTPETRLVRLGDSVVCPACLANSLVEDGGQVAKVLSAFGGAASARGTCLACGDNVGNAGVPFLTGLLCRPCVVEMNRELRAGDLAEQLSSVGPVQMAEPDTSPVEVEFTPGSGTTRCAVCGRSMPGPGSYHVVAGQAVCAGCVNSAKAGVADTSLPQHAQGCACCAGALGDGAQRAAGFEFCAACSQTDLELACAIARLRHKKRMERWRKQALDDQGELP